MRTAKAQILIVLTFVALFGAGAVSGMLATRLSSDRKPPVRRDPDSWIARELSLSPDQHEKMREIWSGVREQMQGLSRDKRRELSRHRDERIRGLLTEAQLAEYEKILADHERKQEELRDAGDRAMRDAEQKTRDMLTAEQRLKYEELLKQRAKGDEKGRPNGGPGGFPGRGGGPSNGGGSPTGGHDSGEAPPPVRGLGGGVPVPTNPPASPEGSAPPTNPATKPSR